ncbi:MAG: outer membrane protein assembly factor BamB family protein [Pirellulales bacterium]
MRTSCFVLVLAAFGASLHGEDWTGFRGPTGQGISTETDLPVQWNATENIAWKTEIPGLGWSSPVVLGTRVFLTTATENNESFRVLCLDRTTGKITWNKEVFRQTLTRKEAKNSYATPTPVTDGTRLYVVSFNGYMAALTLDGQTVWANCDYRFYSQHGMGVSPILYKDLLIVPFDHSSEGDDKTVGWKIPWDKAFILALDKNTGKVRWKATRGLSRIAHVTPAIFHGKDQDQLISGAGNVVQGFNLATGERNWTVFSQGEGVVPSIVIGDGLVYSASGFEQPTIRAIRPDGKGDVTKTHIAWEQTKGVSTVPSFLYLKPYLFTVNESGIAMCLEGDSGKIVWQSRLGGNHAASPVYADGKLYFLSEGGETTVIEAKPEFKIVARNTINERCQASLGVSGGQLFLRSEKNLYCIGKAASKKP